MVDKQLKKLVFEGKTFYYKICFSSGDWGDNYWTTFYLTNDVSTFKYKYWFWGPLVAVPANIIAFRVDYDIESCSKTKEDIKHTLRWKIGILNRCEEIKKGEII